ncbi:MAG: sulfurtransferase TusA family protein [Desulfocucumaceae bacterium]
MSVDLNTVKSNKLVDARGTACPGPILAAKRAIAEISVGEIMEVLSSDSGTNKDIPVWAKKMGHEFIGIVEDAGYWKLFVKRMK